jgi:DNA-binding NarL/FixJ family response regulator
MIRVLLVDDQALVRGGFRMILEAHDDFEVVGEAEDGTSAVGVVRSVAPDVVLMDIRMPGVDGLEATRQIVADRRIRTHVLVLTTFDRDEYVYAALRAGASGFLLKSAPPARLVEAVRLVAGGEALLAPAITRRLIEEYVRGPRPGSQPDALAALTDREGEVLRLIAHGLSNAEIAAHLVVSDATVKTHVNRILSKLDLRDRVQAVVLAYETGLIRPGAGPGT